jgi:hypothetical protein
MTLCIALAMVVSHHRATTARSTTVARTNRWAKTAIVTGQGQPPDTESATYWAARMPAADTNNTVQSMDPWTFWAAGAGQEVWAVTAMTDMDTTDIPTESIPLVAFSTASFLGIDLPETEAHFDFLSKHVMGSLHPWRYTLLQRCGGCAPRASPLPIVREMWTPTTMGRNPLNSRSATLAAERLRRSVLTLTQEQVPLTTMMARIRDGDKPSVTEWNTRGLAGMAALELAMAQRTESLPEVLDCARRGPSRTDRIAALWAARAMGSTDPMIQQVVSAL